MTVLGSWRGFRALLFPVLAVGLGLAPEVAFGQASRVGETFSLPKAFASQTVRWVDIAYDPVNQVYLAVNGAEAIQGHFISQDGVPVGTPFIVHGAVQYAQTPRVAYSAATGGFLVTWHQLVGTTNQVHGNIVRFNQPVGAPFQISDNDTFWEQGAAVAYSTASQEFLVVWNRISGWDVLGRRVSASGQVLGDVIPIAGPYYQRDPTVAYNPNTNEFLVAYAGYFDPGGYAPVSVQRVQAGSGAMVGGPIEITRALNTYVPELSYNAATGQFLIVWYQNQGGTLFNARILNGDGSPASNVLPILPYGFYDALDVAYNSVSGSHFLVTHSSAPDDSGLEISSGGVPGVAFQVTNSGGTGNFNPRLAAHTGRAEWTLVASRQFTSVIAQRIGTTTSGGGPTPPPPPPPPPPPTGPLTPGPITLRTDVPKPWVFAEGAASPATEANGFQTYYQVLNPNIAAGDTVEVKVFFSDDAGNTGWRTFSVPPGSRRTLNLLTETQKAGTYGAVFQSQTPGKQVYVERSIFWGPNWEGSSGEVAAEFDPASPPTRWYFAEGSRDYFQHYFLLFNPTDTVATVNAKYYRQDGAVIQANYTVHPQSRYTIDANAIGGLENTNFSAEFWSSNGFVAERVMYWGPGWMGGHASLGAQSVSPGWHFAEGVAGPNFMTYYTILNPNPWDIWVDADFYLENPQQTLTHPILVGANSRNTISLNGDIGQVGPASAFIRSRFHEGIVVERSIYWGATGWGGIGPVEGTNSVGIAQPALEWFVPEGALGGDWNNYLLLYNPHDFPIQVMVRVLLEDGTKWTDAVPRTLAPKSRKTIDPAFNLYDDAAAQTTFSSQSLGKSYGVNVWSTSGHTFIVEHAIYKAFDGPNYWRTGGAAPGVPKR